jgi:hypothetical protein
MSEECPNCGGLGIVPGCFEDFCSGADCDPEDAEWCCAPMECGWCKPPKRRLRQKPLTCRADTEGQFQLPGIADDTMTLCHLRRGIARGERWVLLDQDGAHRIVGLTEPLPKPDPHA